MIWSEYFYYEGGHLYWLSGKGLAGGLNKGDGYWRVGLQGRRYKNHRIIWEMHNGPIPKGFQIDHQNHDRADNRLENLRLVTSQGNNKNRGLPSNNKSGAIGVSWCKQRNKWRARVHLSGKSILVGYFEAFEDANAAVKAFRAAHGFDPEHGKRI